MATIKYYPNLKIANLDQLSKGTGCRYLVVIKGDGNWIAKRWCRKHPKDDYVIDFK